MDITWTAEVNEQFRIYTGGTAEGFKAIVCAVEPSAEMMRYVMPVRIADSEQGGADLFARSIRDHTIGLQVKINGIDNLCLSECKFGRSFGAARMVVVTPDPAEDDAWHFARKAVHDLQSRLRVPVVSQIDYDQKRLHVALGATLDSIDFAVRHDPSAIATTESYIALLAFKGIDIGTASFSVTGIGDLGGRLVRRLVDLGAAEVVIADRDPKRFTQFATLPTVRPVAMEEVAHAPCHAHILSADKSFNDSIGAAWAKNVATVVVGGPEAGIDRFKESRALLASHGKEFVPSVLCGSLGLVSNLEEALGIRPDLGMMCNKFRRLMTVLTDRMEQRDVGLATACEELLQGRAPLDDREQLFVTRSTYAGGNPPLAGELR